MIDINQMLILKSHWNKVAKCFGERDTRKMCFYPYSCVCIYCTLYTYLPHHFTAIQFISWHTIFPSMALHFYQSFHILNICNKFYNVKRGKSSRKSINDDDADIDDGDGGGDKKNKATHCLHSLHVNNQISTA